VSMGGEEAAGKRRGDGSGRDGRGGWRCRTDGRGRGCGVGGQQRRRREGARFSGGIRVGTPAGKPSAR
jgi:hypothetical protein